MREVSSKEDKGGGAALPMTRISTGPRADSSFRPSCSWIASSAAGCPAGPWAHPGFNVPVAHVWAEQERLLEKAGQRMPVEDGYIAASKGTADPTKSSTS